MRRPGIKAMTLEAFQDELRDRGGEVTVWLVYLADVMMELEAGHPSLVLQHGFFTRGGAYAFAERLHQQRRWQHYYVFRLVADSVWAVGEERREAEYETAFGRIRPLPAVHIMPGKVARALST
jgi:hypothetical protein